MFAYRGTRGRVELAFTNRHGDDAAGGPAGGPASLDLSSGRTDRPEDPVVFAATLDLLGRAFTGTRQPAPASMGPGGPTPAPAGASQTVSSASPSPPRLVLMRQVHGRDVAVVDAGALERGDVPVADALVTQLPGVVLVVRVADCVPVLLADERAGVVAAVHAGRPGLVAGVVPAAVAAMRRLGASDIHAWVGPHVCGACYEVPAEMRRQVAAVVPEAFGETSWGTPSVDIGAGVHAQLGAEGVSVTDKSRCTVEDDDLFSYRREGTASGRLGGLVWTRP